MKIKLHSATAQQPQHCPPDSPNIDFYADKDVDIPRGKAFEVTSGVGVQLSPGTRVCIVAHPLQAERGLRVLRKGYLNVCIENLFSTVLWNDSGSADVTVRRGEPFVRFIVLNSDGAPVFDDIYY